MRTIKNAYSFYKPQHILVFTILLDFYLFKIFVLISMKSYGENQIITL